MVSKRIYFPGLNGVRFIAALLVILDHLELFKGYFGFRTMWSHDFSFHLGSLGVTIFFVLSGFLITYLLLEEKKFLQINVLNFYIRRVLRIWPLYFLILIISFFIIPHLDFFKVPVYSEDIGSNFIEKFMLSLFFLANVAFVYFPPIPFGNILWSVAVEEQFYLIWPNLIKRFKKIFIALLVALFIYMTIKVSVIINLFGLKHMLPEKIDSLLDKTRFSCMIIGGLGAVLAFQKKPQIIKYLFSGVTQLLLLAFFVVLFFDCVRFPFFFLVKNELISLVVVLILINVSTNKNSILRLENRLFNFLGKISYGLYVFHLFAILICVKIFALFYPAPYLSYPVWSFFLLLCSVLLTIFISYFSYTYFESKILKKKTKYSTIISGDLAAPKK